MKKLRSSNDHESYGDKVVTKDYGRREDDLSLHRSSSLRKSSYHRSYDGGKKGSSSASSRYDRLEEEVDRGTSRLVRKRSDRDFSSSDRRKNYDRRSDGNERGILSSSPRAGYGKDRTEYDRGILSPSPRVGYGKDRTNRTESLLGQRRDFPKWVRSEKDRERDRSRRECSVSSWWRFGAGKDSDNGTPSDGTELSRGSKTEAKCDGTELSRGSKTEAKSDGKIKSPEGKRDAKSPAWSKDSGSEQSKSVGFKKCEDLPMECSVHSSEREEGELEPDPQSVPLTNLVVVDENADKSNSDADKTNSSQKELNSECHNENEDVSKVETCEKATEYGLSKDAHDDVDKARELPDCQDTELQGTRESRDENEIMVSNVGSNNEEEARVEARCEEIEATCALNPSASEEERKKDKGLDSKVKEDDTAMDENEGSVEGKLPVVELTGHNSKDKGKIVALLPKSNSSSPEGLEAEIVSKGDLETIGETEMEGPSTRGFEFFSNNPVKEQEKVEQSSHNPHKDENLALELSLSLPNVLLPIGAQNGVLEPGSSSRAQSFSTFRTNSDGLTMSMSFSGSQQFTHNPSCSLTNNTYDYEKSVGSRPIFQGVDWNALSSENKNKEVPVSQGMGSKGNVSHKNSQASHENISGQAVLQHLTVGGSSKVPFGLENQLSFRARLSGAHSFESKENGSRNSKERRQVMKEKCSGNLHRIDDPHGEKQALASGADFAESIVTMIVSEPIESMAHRFNTMAVMHMTCLKDFVRDIISDPGKQWQLSALQKALRNRSDIQQDGLVKIHRTQLEIMVALKTGLQEFLKQNHDIPSSDLAEIFLNMRCRNLTCQSLLPVDECDCKICVQRNGFCRECMCLVCSKFDMASNTCSWVGCDVCLHWCHADCGLRESLVRNGSSASSAQGTAQMQFHCVACDHPSEMFGFVKEVFQNFVKTWTAENLSRELEYVRRIFFASKDERGKQLHDTAVQMVSQLANKADLREMQNRIMAFFNDADLLKPQNVSTNSRMEVPRQIQETLNGISGSSQDASWFKSFHSQKTPYLESSISLLPTFDHYGNDKYATAFDLQKDVRKESPFDELEGVVRIKQAEAKMFQTRSDDATREAEDLKRIAAKKNERIEEEYASRIRKLRLTEAEEMRKRKLEELQACERAYQEYISMKMRMESDIKQLLLKMGK